MATLIEIAAVLETTEANVFKRLAGLRLLPTCGRCGGCGEYSFNGTHSRCYDCNGNGQRKPKDSELATILERAETAKSDGSFATYMRFLAARKVTATATKAVMEAWKATGITEAYDWRKSYGAAMVKRDNDIATINKKMADAYDRVSTAAHALNPRADDYQAQVTQLAEETVPQALADIETAREQLVAYLEGTVDA